HDGTAITAAGLGGLTHLERAAASGGADPAKAPGSGVRAGEVAASGDATPAQVRSAVTRALPPLQNGLIVYGEKRDCFSCHNQGVPLIALAIARSRGFRIDDDALQGAVSLTRDDLEGAVERYRQGRGQPGGATRAAYALWTLEASGHPPDEVTA